jgi:preprotein translocase subunit SecD
VAQALLRLALCQKKKGDGKQAAAGLEKLIERYPDETATVERARAELARLKPAAKGPAGGDDALVKSAKLLPGIKATFFEAVRAVEAKDAAGARKAMEALMPQVKDLEALIKDTAIALPIGLAIRQLERFDAAVRSGDIGRAAAIAEALNAVGAALETMIKDAGAKRPAASGKGPAERVAFRLVAADDDPSPADELIDPADTTGTSPKLRVLREAIVDGGAVESAEPREAAGGSGWEIAVRLNEAGAAALAEASSRSIGRRLAIVVDGKVVSSPVIRSAVGKDIVISGRFAHAEAVLLSEALAPKAK